ncbi:hypothetical protein FBU30_000969 [Linnemannia zychae]|nr:hypothetical protein FBU30_000969 [Linnemannia zychae]
MGLKGFYWWLRKKKGYNPTLRQPKRHSLPENAMVRVDVLTFYNKIRWTYTKYAHDKPKAHGILFAHIKNYGDPLRMVYYVDGVPAMEKKETHRKRNAKRVKALKAAEVAINILSERISQDKPPTKVMFKNVDKNMRGTLKHLHGPFRIVKTLLIS